jgi:putative NADPH-quinone reductase
MTTIILAHPWHGSFNKAILDSIVSKYDNNNTPYQIIDLHKDNFNPVTSESELAVYNAGKALDPLVIKYQEIIKKTGHIIFIFPIWWGTMPAILKGFFDKVLLKDIAFSYENGWTPLLKINKTTIITTSDNVTSAFENSIMNTFVPQMLEGVGIMNAKWFNCERVGHETDEYRKVFLEEVTKNI